MYFGLNQSAWMVSRPNSVYLEGRGHSHKIWAQAYNKIKELRFFLRGGQLIQAAGLPGWSTHKGSNFTRVNAFNTI